MNTDLGNVIRGLECCSNGADREPIWNHLTARNCGKCPYNKPGIACTRALVYDALELLKSDCLVKVIRCKDCQMWRSPSEEDISDGITTGYCNNAGFGTEPFGFCSDAIRR